MKTLTNYIKNYNSYANTLQLLENEAVIDESQIEEGLGSWLKKAFGKYFKMVGAMSNAAADVLLPDEKKQFQQAQEKVMGTEDTKNMAEEKDADKVIKYIDEKFDKFKEESKISDETVAKFKIVAAMQFHTQHKDDETYKKKMADYIEKLKKDGGDKVKKFAEEYAKQLQEVNKKEGEGDKEENGDKATPSEEEAKEIDKDADKITKTIGVNGDGDNVQKAVKPVMPSDPKDDEKKEALEDIFGEPILEGETKMKDMPQELQNFKKSFLYKSGALSKNPDALKTNRDCILIFASAVDGVLSKMVNTKGKSASSDKAAVLKALSQMVELEEFKKYLGK